MNLIFRLLLTCLRYLLRRRPPRSHRESFRLRFRCLPLDCDFNLHMTNSRYASFCDLARIGVMFETGALLRLLRRGMTPIVTAQNIVHMREINLGQVFTVESRILSWDDRFWYFQHDFLQAGALKARVFAKGFFVCKRKVIGFKEVLAVSASDGDVPELSPQVRAWSEMNDQLFRQK